MSDEEDTIEFGDTVRIVGERKALKEVAALLGNERTCPSEYYSHFE